MVGCYLTILMLFSHMFDLVSRNFEFDLFIYLLLEAETYVSFFPCIVNTN